MAKDKITEYDATANNNTVVGDVNLAENSALPSDMNNAIREVMSHQKEAFGSGTPLYVDQTNNRVGVNKTPTVALDVSGDLTVSGAFTSLGIDDNASSNVITVSTGGFTLSPATNNLYLADGTLSYYGTTNNVYLNGAGSGGGLLLSGDGTRAENIDIDASENNIKFTVGTAERMRIDSSGNVGIGTTSPTVQLHVKGTSSANNAELRLEEVNGDIVQLISISDEFRIGTVAANPIAFRTGNTERMRIDANGRMQITSDGQASFTSDASLEVRGQNAPLVKFNHTQNADEVVLQIRHDQARSGQTATMVQILNNSNSEVGTIKANVSATAFNTSSDYRLKENVTYDFDATSRLKKLKPARFNFIADENNTTVDGFIAHEVSSIVPEAISGEKDAMTKEVLYADGDEIPNGKKVGDVKEASKIAPQGIDQSKLVPLLTKTLQETLTRIDTLEAEVKTLKGE